MEIIEQIGSYAGLAAVVGLAVMSVLYFSQARDVKRLREWAGRAPERAPTSYPQRVVAQPAQPAQPQAPPSPPRAPVPPGAQPSGAGAGPSVAAGPVAATPAAARAAETAKEGEAPAVSQNTVTHPPPRPPPQTLAPRQSPPGLGGHFAREAELAQQREEARRREQDPATAAEVQDDDGLQSEELEGHELEAEELESHEFDAEREDGQSDEGLHPEEPDLDQVEDRAPSALAASLPPPPPSPVAATNRSLPRRPAPPPTRAAPPRAPILPPYEKSRPGGGAWESRSFSPGKAALAVGATVVVVAAGAFGVLQLTGGDDEPATGPVDRAAPAREQAGDGRAAAGRGAVNPRNITVSVLNGTTVGGLAAQLGDRLEAQGFQLGNVTNNTDQQRAESVVLYAPGAEAEARDVGRRLKIDQREPIDPDSQTRAGDATVVVVTGNDLND